MAAWAWVLGQLTAQGGGAPPRVDMIGPMERAQGRRLEFNLRGACRATWTVDGLDEHARFISELTTDLFVWRNRELFFRGRVGSCDDDISADGHEMSCSAVDYRGLLERRVLLIPHDYFLWNPEHIGLEMLNIAQLDIEGYTGGGSLGFLVGQGGDDLDIKPGRPLVTEFFDADTNVMQNIDRFQDYDGDVAGFEWWVDPHPDWQEDAARQLIFRTRSWRGYERDDFPLVLGTTVDAVRRQFDTAAYANHVIVRGGKPDMPIDPPDIERGDDPDADIVWIGEPGGQTWGSAPNNRYTMRTDARTWPAGRYIPDARWYQPPPGPDGKENKQDRTLWYWNGSAWQRGDELPEPWQTRQAGDWHRRPMGRISRTANDSDLKTQEAVDAAADAMLYDCLRPAASFDVDLRDGIWKGPADCWLGDRVPLYVRSGRLDTTTTARVWTVAIDIDEAGDEKVSMTLDQIDAEDWS